jgi:hypothetical protein
VNAVVKFILAFARHAIVPAVVGYIESIADVPDIATAKSRLNANIQSQHHWPGELRRFLVSEVDSVSAGTVEAFAAALVAKMEAL